MPDTRSDVQVPQCELRLPDVTGRGLQLLRSGPAMPPSKAALFSEKLLLPVSLGFLGTTGTPFISSSCCSVPVWTAVPQGEHTALELQKELKVQERKNTVDVVLQVVLSHRSVERGEVLLGTVTVRLSCASRGLPRCLCTCTSGGTPGRTCGVVVVFIVISLLTRGTLVTSALEDV